MPGVHKGWLWIGAGLIAFGLYGVVATLPNDDNFGRILAACDGVFVAGSIAFHAACVAPFLPLMGSSCSAQMVWPSVV
ncbi:MAG: hypothetical protein HOY79_41140 [Streptomyces sp.]|nr:hypothetical protein [Streptomyces sp.]